MRAGLSGDTFGHTLVDALRNALVSPLLEHSGKHFGVRSGEFSCDCSSS